MAVDMFIKIDTVDGEAQDSKHKEEIDYLGRGGSVTPDRLILVAAPVPERSMSKT